MGKVTWRWGRIMGQVTRFHALWRVITAQRCVSLGAQSRGQSRLTAHLTCPVRGLRSGCPVRPLHTGPFIHPQLEPTSPTRPQRAAGPSQDRAARGSRGPEGEPRARLAGPPDRREGRTSPPQTGPGRDERPWGAVTARTGGGQPLGCRRGARLSETGTTVTLPDKRTREDFPSRGQRAPLGGQRRGTVRPSTRVAGRSTCHAEPDAEAWGQRPRRRARA